MNPIRDMTQAELGALVQSHLRANDISVVLSGGAAVSIYTEAKYTSLDLDLVNIYHARFPIIRKHMSEIGFTEKGRYFKHPESAFPVEFPPGPLAFGDEEIAKVKEIRLSTGILKIISPTDCVKDRLAAFYHWGDRQCLQQAILVAESQEVDMQEIAKWSANEGKVQEFDEFKSVVS